MMHAGAMQVPTLTSDIPCLTETMEEGVTGMSFSVRDSASLLAAMETDSRGSGLAYQHGSRILSMCTGRF